MNKFANNHPRVVAGLVFVLMAGTLLCNVFSFAPVDVDEPSWISSGFLTWRLVTGATASQKWAAAFDELGLGPFGNLNPPVGKFMIGAAVALARQSDDPVHYKWAWPYDYNFNLKAGRIPPRPLLISVRGFIALLALAALILTYLIACELMSDAQWIPLLAPMILFFNSSFQACATRVFTDIPQMTLTLLAIWLTLLWFRRQNHVALFGAFVFMGLACATKFSAGTLVISTVVVMFLAPAGWPARICRVVAAVLIPAIVFVAVNPYLWSHPFSGTSDLMHQWSEMLKHQQTDPALIARAVTDRLTATRLVLWNCCLLARSGWDPVGLTMAWNAVLVTILAFAGVTSGIFLLLRYRAGFSTLQRRQAMLALVVGLSGVAALFCWRGRALAALLLVAGIWRIVKHLQSRRRLDGVGYFALVTAVTLVATVAWLPFDWNRYYMPALGLMPILAAFGAFELLRTDGGRGGRGRPPSNELVGSRTRTTDEDDGDGAGGRSFTRHVISNCA